MIAIVVGRGAERAGRRGRVWRPLLPAVALVLALLTAPATGHARPLARHYGCHLHCWARVFVDGQAVITVQNKGVNFTDDNRIDFDFHAASPAFVVSRLPTFVPKDFVNLGAGLRGEIEGFKLETTRTTLGCSDQKEVQTISTTPLAGGLSGMTNADGMVPIYMRIDVDDSDPADMPTVTFDRSNYQCGGQEIHPNPAHGMANGWPETWQECNLPPEIVHFTLGPDQPHLDVFYRQSCRYDVGDEHAYQHVSVKTSAAMVFELCPDQDLRNNCALRGHPDLPPPPRR